MTVFLSLIEKSLFPYSQPCFRSLSLHSLQAELLNIWETSQYETFALVEISWTE